MPEQNTNPNPDLIPNPIPPAPIAPVDAPEHADPTLESTATPSGELPQENAEGAKIQGANQGQPPESKEDPKPEPSGISGELPPEPAVESEYANPALRPVELQHGTVARTWLPTDPPPADSGPKKAKGKPAK